jgi:crotonobetainyl-CoA:carnitine CoA-transferase CaiB-like acyl-CoA transferase
MSGIMSVTGAPEGQPQKVGIAVTDILTGLYSVNAILAALHSAGPDGAGSAYRHGASGRGHRLHGEPGDELPHDGVAPERIGNAHQNLTPYQVFDCADGWIIIATGNDAQYRRLCALLGLEDMARRPTT